MLPLTQPHADRLLNLNAGHSSVTHFIPDWEKKKKKRQTKILENTENRYGVYFHYTKSINSAL